VFKAEEKCYKEQEITYDEVRFVDNQDVLDLVELRPNGLLPKLDDEVKVPKGSDMGYLDKIQKIHADNPRFKARVRRGNESREFEFGINHYAGLVHYDVRNFMEKNKDELLLNLRELLQGSSNAFLQLLFNEETNPSAILAAKAAEAAGMSGPPLQRQGSTAAGGGGGGTGGKGDKLSQAHQFRTQLDALMKTLNATAPHYIRCIKPNASKKARMFEAPICLQQLRYAGVFEAVKIRQQGFPFRWSYEHFYKRYRCIGIDKFFRM
jgi:myosin heavy subunit